MLGIPMANLKEGNVSQEPFTVVDQVSVAPTLCYEDLFSETIRQWWSKGEAPGILINLSNLGWFGDSAALPQHLSISRMRAKEFARPIVRATNTGRRQLLMKKGESLLVYRSWCPENLMWPSQRQSGSQRPMRV